MSTPTAAPCIDCRTTGGSRPKNQSRPRRTQGYCAACYQRHIRNRDIALRPAVGGWTQEPHPAIPTGLITPQMIGITADEIAERCADAAYDLKLTESAALYRGLDWRDRHPEQFQPEALAALYPDPAGLAFSAWVENAERRAA